MKNRSIARLCIRVGQFAARRNDLAQARDFFARAIRFAPFEVEAYPYWLGTLGGGTLTGAYVTWLHWLRRMRSGRSQLYPKSVVPRPRGRWISK